MSLDTGGIYERTEIFPEAAMERVERILSGYYLLTFRKPSPGPGRHQIDVGLARRKGTVLHRHFSED